MGIHGASKPRGGYLGAAFLLPSCVGNGTSATSRGEPTHPATALVLKPLERSAHRTERSVPQSPAREEAALPGYGNSQALGMHLLCQWAGAFFHSPHPTEPAQ